MKRKRKIRRDYYKFDVDQFLLSKRYIFLFGDVNEDSATTIVKQILALDKQSGKPLLLWINSRGGSVDDGFAIIDAIKSARSSVLTIIMGQACSMAGIISVAGDKRFMTDNSVWMAHDLAGGIRGDYTTKVLDRATFLKHEQARLHKFLKEHTKLTDSEIIKGQHGELWLYPDDCKMKGIIDEIVRPIKNLPIKPKRKK